MADRLLLCQGSEDERQAGRLFTHLPTPATVGAGFVAPGAGSEIRVPRPHHAFQIKLDGQIFPFVVALTALDDRSLGFFALEAHALTYSTPWNQVEYGDVLWAQETKESLSLIPIITAMAALV